MLTTTCVTLRGPFVWSGFLQCLEMDTNPGTRIHPPRSAQCLSSSERTCTIMVNLLIGFPIENYYSLVMKSTWDLPFWGTSMLLCSSQPNHLLPGTVSSHLFQCSEQIAGWTSSSPVVPSAGLLLSLLSQISEVFSLLLVFMYVSEVCVVWGLVWAAVCFSWK